MFDRVIQKIKSGRFGGHGVHILSVCLHPVGLLRSDISGLVILLIVIALKTIKPLIKKLTSHEGFYFLSGKRYTTETQLEWKTTRKSYVAYQLTLISMTSNDVEDHSLTAGLLNGILCTNVQ